MARIGYPEFIMLTTLLAIAMFAGGPNDLPICPVMGHEVPNLKGDYSDFNGTRYWYCCDGCKDLFEKTPAKIAASHVKGKAAAGIFLFDPVSGARLKPEKAIKAHSDYNGVRFLFATAANKAEFDKDPKKYGTMPEKEALYCSVGKEAVASYGAASGYVDHNGVRYYLCCAGCDGEWKKDKDKHAGLAATHVKAPGIATEKAK